jgi:3-hydroxyisobutyrate/3-hydroxypropionate dehydrogenase
MILRLTLRIGLGVMGWPMALNLRSKLGADTTMLICDVSEDALARFENKTQSLGPVRRVESGFQAAVEAVRFWAIFFFVAV